MSQKEKLWKKFIKAPHTLKYTEIEKLLLWKGFVKKQAKGSHVKFSHPDFLHHRIIFAIHNGDCKNYMKEDCLKILHFCNFD